MREFAININFTVDARDYDEAVEIAKAVRREITDPTGQYKAGYKLRDVETPHGGIEEL